MQQNTFLLYGANGYTGELIARYAAEYNLQPILAGRREEVIKPLAEKLSLFYKIFSLDNTAVLHETLKEVKVVVHAAGPYDYTAKQMVEACLQTGTHYLDLNGDLVVFEMLKSYNDAAKNAGVMLLPGAGFDVVPTDCMALFLKKLLPGAVSLKLAFAILGSGLSRGTAITTTEKLGEPGASRKNGVIVPEPVGKKGMWIDFGEKKLFVMSLPWGDVSTAYFTTGIPDIEAYTGISNITWQFLKLQPLFNWILKKSSIRNFIKKQINKRSPGPGDAKRNNAKSLIWGQVRDADGKTVTATMSTPEAYDLTAYSTLLITQKILNGEFSPGYQTPASAYGENLVMEIKNVKRNIVQ